MRILNKLLIGGVGLAALATAAPSASQYYYGQGSYPYGYNNYGYNNYGYNNYAYGYGMNTSAAASQCTAAVQNRLYTRNAGGIIGALLGAYGTTGRVLSVTRVTPNYNYTRVRGLASSGRYGYGTADLSFRCDVDARGYVRDVDINRR